MFNVRLHLTSQMRGLSALGGTGAPPYYGHVNIFASLVCGMIANVKVFDFDSQAQADSYEREWSEL